MADIAVVKVRTPQDLEWHPSPVLKELLSRLGLHSFVRKLDAASGKPFMPQLALPYLAALGERYNERAGTRHKFYLFDEPPERLDLDGFDMVWFTAGTHGALATYEVSDALRAKGIPTVIGGIHATMLPEEAGRHATAVARGEAEGLVERILADFDSGTLQPVYRSPRAATLAGMPVPRWQDAVVPDYASWLVPVETSRGCMNACRFCSTTRFQGAHRRHRPVEEVVAEIRALQEMGVLTPEKEVFFTDNNIVWDADYRRGRVDGRYSRALFEALVPLGINWVGQGEITVAKDRDLVALMAASGCHVLLVGLETLDVDGLGDLGKPCNDPAFYEEAIGILHDHGIAVIGCFVLGLDEDGPEVFERVERFVERWVDIPQVTILTPYPGTALYRDMKRQGRLLHEDWSKYDVTNVVFRPLRMSPEELEEGYLRVTDRIYRYSKLVARAARYALRPTVNGMPRFGTLDRFTSILAPNIVYRWLSRASRQERVRRSFFERLKDSLWNENLWRGPTAGTVGIR